MQTLAASATEAIIAAYESKKRQKDFLEYMHDAQTSGLPTILTTRWRVVLV